VCICVGERERQKKEARKRQRESVYMHTNMNMRCYIHIYEHDWPLRCQDAEYDEQNDPGLATMSRRPKFMVSCGEEILFWNPVFW